MNWFESRFAQLLLLVGVFVMCNNMGDGGPKYSTSDRPMFAPLEEKEGSYPGVIHDNGVKTEIRDLSFFGHATVGGIRKEDDDSFNRLDLAKVKEIQVKQPVFDSKRYSSGEFSLIHVVTKKGTTIKNLLVPRKVVICGVEKSTGAQKSWWIHKIDKVSVGEQIPVKQLMEEKLKEQKRKESIQKQTAAEVKTKKDKESPSIIGSFIGVIDSIIDFFKAIVSKVLRLAGF